jgi:hypothetical protein
MQPSFREPPVLRPATSLSVWAENRLAPSIRCTLHLASTAQWDHEDLRRRRPDRVVVVPNAIDEAILADPGEAGSELEAL